MSVEFLQEVTDWSNVECSIPNHTYIFNENKQCVGYIKSGTHDIQMFKKPSVHFSRTGRKFTKLTKDTIKRLVYPE